MIRGAFPRDDPLAMGGGDGQQRRRGMPDTIRISGSCAHPWRRGFLTAIVGAVFPFPASAEPQPVLALHELVVSAQDSIDRHEIAVLVVVLGLVLFAVVTAIMLVRARTRWARLETSSRDEIATLRSDLDRANALLFSEPQVMVTGRQGPMSPASTAIQPSSALPRPIACSLSALGSNPARLSPWSRRSKTCAAAAKVFR
jgi:hypothetical protein